MDSSYPNLSNNAGTAADKNKTSAMIGSEEQKFSESEQSMI